MKKKKTKRNHVENHFSDFIDRHSYEALTSTLHFPFLFYFYFLLANSCCTLFDCRWLLIVYINESMTFNWILCPNHFLLVAYFGGVVKFSWKGVEYWIGRSDNVFRCKNGAFNSLMQWMCAILRSINVEYVDWNSMLTQKCSCFSQ